MNTKEIIISTANNLLIERGYNAFSYKTIAQEIGIRTSSIHYYFPTKTDLGIAIINSHSKALQGTIERNESKTALEKLHKLFLYYERLAQENKVCIVSALTSDINTLEESLQLKLLEFSNAVADWTTTILEEGQLQKTFKPLKNTSLKAKMIITNLMGLIQITRIEKDKKIYNEMSILILEELTMDLTA